MVMALFGRVLPSALAAVIFVGLLGGCSEGRSLFGGCTERDKQLFTTLAGLPILKAHPVSAEVTTLESGCDTDDGFAYASHRYRTELNRQDIVAFYRKAAADDGWLPDGEQPAPPTDGLVVTAAVACFLKQVDGTTAHFQVWFPSDLKIPDQPHPTALGEYGLDVTASHDGTAWC